ncbi:MAG: MATE family efflux transporter [Muribaculaceae bacterium]|nr:MATE family efflux transporter [Muribaculaceae bacterium]
MKTKNTIDMLSGPLPGPTLRFALPLIATGIVQQSFNSADTLVVGRYCASSALAAVGSNGPVVNLIVTLFLGLGVGINVVVASCIGRRDDNAVRRAVATTGVLALVCGIATMILGSLFARPLLEALSTPEEVIDGAATYLRIIFLGLPFLTIYNFGAAVLRSVGDTARPFYILLAGGVANVGLDLLFVAGMGRGVEGVALATTIGMGLNAVLIVLVLMREKSAIRLEPRKMKTYGRELGQIVKIGLPAGLQGLVFSLSNVFILSSINSFGAAASAGSAAAISYELYSYYLIVAFVQACVAFTSQNYAAGNIERCNKVYRLNMLLAVIACGVVNCIIVWQKGFFAGIFTDDGAVLPFAYSRMTIVLLFQFIACSYEVSGGAMRALGYSMTPTVITILGTCVFRLLWVWALPRIGGDFRMLMAIYPITWVITGTAVLFAYFTVRRKAYSKLASAPAHHNG